MVHTSEFLAGEGLQGSGDEQPMEQAIKDVVAQFNRSIDVPSVLVSGVTTSSAPFQFDKSFNDTTPTIHVGFTSDLEKDLNGEQAGGVTTLAGPVNDANGCPLERDIEFPTADDPNPAYWDFNTPFTADRDSSCGPAADPTNYEYYDAGASIPVKAEWAIPNHLGSDLHPIVHVVAGHFGSDGSPDLASIRVNWIPLRGTITVS